MKQRHEKALSLVCLLAPGVVIFASFVLYPAAHALAYSLQHWDGIGQPEWVGLANFRQIFAESGVFLQAFQHNVFLIVTSGAGSMALALSFAALIHRGIRGAGFFRVVFFFPNMIASVAVALLWLLLYSTTDFGLINQALGLLEAGLARTGASIGVELPFAFTDSRHLLWSMIPMLIWVNTGFYMLLFLAGMQNIPESLYEAATIDGAGGIRQFFQITLPLLREVIVVGAIFYVIAGLKVFDLIWVMENQWPTSDTHVMATLLYQKVFSEYNVGEGSAIAVVLFVIIFLATLATLKLSRKEALEF